MIEERVLQTIGFIKHTDKHWSKRLPRTGIRFHCWPTTNRFGIMGESIVSEKGDPTKHMLQHLNKILNRDTNG